MPYPHDKHVRPTFNRWPNVGFCDRCQFEWPLDALKPQKEWAGFALVNTGARVCPTCMDEPQQQKRALILGPEPKPLRNARPQAPYAGPPVEQFMLDESELDGEDRLP